MFAMTWRWFWWSGGVSGGAALSAGGVYARYADTARVFQAPVGGS